MAISMLCAGGPAFAPQGIWRNLTLEATDTAAIRDVLVQTTPLQVHPSVLSLLRL